MRKLLTKTKTILAGLVLLPFLGGGVGQAATITLNWVDTGWYNSSGNHLPGNTNYIAGNSGLAWRNFFVFDLSGVNEIIIGATLKLYNPSSTFPVGDPTALYTLYDVTTPVPNLVAGGSGIFGTYHDLGSGISYGSRIFSAADIGTTVNIALNPNGLTALNGASGLFALGGRVTNTSGNYVSIFGNSQSSSVRQLVLETQPVPEPSTMLLLGSGLIGLVGYRMKKPGG